MRGLSFHDPISHFAILAAWARCGSGLRPSSTPPHDADAQRTCWPATDVANQDQSFPRTPAGFAPVNSGERPESLVCAGPGAVASTPRLRRSKWSKKRRVRVTSIQGVRKGKGRRGHRYPNWRVKHSRAGPKSTNRIRLSSEDDIPRRVLGLGRRRVYLPRVLGDGRIAEGKQNRFVE